MEPLVEKKWDWLASLGPLLWQVTRSSFRKKIAPDWSGAYHSRKQRGVRPLIDVYLPKTDGPTPSVLMLHGGGFVSGDRRMSSMTLLAKTLNERGIAAASIDYRLLFRGGRLAEAVDDVRVAYDWWRAQADRFSLERDRVAVLGCSAGAALAVLASPDLKALWKLIAVYGVYNFGTLPGPKGLGARLLLGSSDRERWVAESPLAKLGADVPTLLLHGRSDRLVGERHTRELAAARVAANFPVVTRFYTGQPHGFLLDGVKNPAVVDALRDIHGFLQPHS